MSVKFSGYLPPLSPSKSIVIIKENWAARLLRGDIAITFYWKPCLIFRRLEVAAHRPRAVLWKSGYGKPDNELTIKNRYIHKCKPLKFYTSPGIQISRNSSHFSGLLWYWAKTMTSRPTPRTNEYVFVRKRKQFVFVKTLHRFLWKRKLLKTLLKDETFENSKLSFPCGLVVKTRRV